MAPRLEGKAALMAGGRAGLGIAVEPGADGATLHARDPPEEISRAERP